MNTVHRGVVWELLDDRYSHMWPEVLGFISFFLDEDDARSASEQFNENYAHGGGWEPCGPKFWASFEGFELDPSDMSITYPSDPAYKPIAKATLHNKEHVYVYPHAWVMIFRSVDDWEIARLD